jgi:hypothetical protein
MARILSGKQPYILAIDALFPPMQSILERLINYTIAKGYARWVIDLIPEEKQIWEYPTRVLLHNVFGETEDWHNKFYRLAQPEKKFPEYAMAYKLLTCNFAKPKHLSAYLLGKVLASKSIGMIHIIGLPRDTIGLTDAYWKQNYSDVIKPAYRVSYLINPFTFILTTLFSFAWIVSRIRITAKSEQVFFAADYIGDHRDIPLYHEVNEGGPVLLVRRNSSIKVLPHGGLDTFKSCTPDCGWLNPIQAILGIATVCTDAFRLFANFLDREPGLYYQIAALPYRRLMIRALINRYRPKYYWGRDDYNVEHIIRRQELHRAGGISLGIQHGFPVSTTVYPMWRYISFDTYFVAGLAVYEKHLKTTWATDMEVIPIGTFGATREDYEYINLPKPKNIIIFTAMAVGEPELVSFVRDLAETLPTYKIFLQVKFNFVETETGRRFIDACTEGLHNVSHTRESVFNLFRQGRYIFTDPSTLISEALKMRLNCFAIDILSYHKSSILRDFPEICVSSGVDAGNRIKEIESGERQYPRESFAGLSDLSDTPIFDVIRREVGLPYPGQATGLRNTNV